MKDWENLNFETRRTILIIENNEKLYEFRKSFKDFVETRIFYSCKREIFGFVEIDKINWKDVYDYFQSNPLFLSFGLAVFYYRQCKTEKSKSKSKLG